jgi:16S rRNA C967 or C1407 C5-methylase (RsmB/RsmF family)/NOL1/NOP2/fmu family ribosome biogenesis protein
MSNQLGEEFHDFEASLLQTPSVSLRVNPMKAPDIFSEEEKVPWSVNGRFLKERPEFVFDPLIHAGAYYVQESSSMMIANAIDFSSNLRILDLCASPGGKSTLLLSLMNSSSVLFSNELVGKRTTILKENIVKWGYPNVVITSNRANDYKDFKGYFDVVLVDAPCSGEGMFRKNPVAIKEWNDSKPFSCSIEQKGILENAVPLVRDGGLLIFSTCTFAPQENENNVEWLYKKFAGQLSPALLSYDKNWGITEDIVTHSDGNKQSVYKCLPHKFRGEGLFISMFRVNSGNRFVYKTHQQQLLKNINSRVSSDMEKFIKTGEDHMLMMLNEQVVLMNKQMAGIADFAMSKLNVVSFGTLLGNISYNTREFIPTHDLSMSILVNKNYASVELNREQAIRFLKKEDIPGLIPDPEIRGWLLAKYQGVPLGWLKANNNRTNNFYPKEWRLRKEWLNQ